MLAFPGLTTTSILSSSSFGELCGAQCVNYAGHESSFLSGAVIATFSDRKVVTDGGDLWEKKVTESGKHGWL